MKSYKGFNMDLQCDGDGHHPFQYEVGKEYEEPEAVVCDKGFHACENPFDVFKYYPPANSRYCEVEQSGEISRDPDDSKVASTKIRIVKEIGLMDIVEAGVEFIKNKIKFENTEEYNTGYRSAATNTGNWSAATNTGNWSAATNTGDWSAATNTGDWSAATNTGYYSAATNTGDRSAATNTGKCSAATNTGCCSTAAVSGADSVAISVGIEGQAKGSLGCYIVLAEWYQDEYYSWHIKELKSAKVDGETIKVDTLYQLKDGKFIEVEE